MHLNCKTYLKFPSILKKKINNQRNEKQPNL